MIESKNIFYISNFNTIGGVETYIFELARKYKDYDITIIYKTGSQEQVERLREYVRVIKYNNEKVKCKKIFCNYETDILDNVEAEERIQLIHAMFKTQGITPRIDSRIDTFYCVSESAGKEWEELTGIKPILNRNPLMITKTEKEPAIFLISATRLTKEKGKDRMIQLGKLLDKANINYVWLVFTNDQNKIDNPNIIYMRPRLNIRPFIASIKDKGYGVQLSDCEGDCYFTRECEALGVPLLVTPVPSFKEQGLKDEKNCYFVPFDMAFNIEKIKKIPKFEPFQYTDKWKENLVKSKSEYKPEEKVKVITTCGYNDVLLKRYVEVNEELEVTKSRADTLISENVAKMKEI